MKHAQLWKRILNEGLFYDLVDTHPDQTETDIIKATQIVDGRTRELESEISWSSFSNMAIPAENVWIEGAVGQDLLWGTLIQSQRTDEGWNVRLWCVTAGKIPTCFGWMQVKLDRNGTVATNANETISCTNSISDHMLKQYPKEMVLATVLSAAAGAFDVLTLLGCKNVSLSPRTGEEKQVQRAIKRHGGNADKYRYHVLVVRPAGARSDAPEQEIGVMPRHVCRGHFQHYGLAAEHGHPDKRDRGLLFGKLAGRFFVPPCVKGDKKNGIVEKDYEIPATARA